MLKEDIADAINAVTGDETELRTQTEEVVDYLFNNCNEADLLIVYDEIGVVCRRHKDE